jgi:hypothetical protein
MIKKIMFGFAVLASILMLMAPASATTYSRWRQIREAETIFGTFNNAAYVNLRDVSYVIGRFSHRAVGYPDAMIHTALGNDTTGFIDMLDVYVAASDYGKPAWRK